MGFLGSIKSLISSWNGKRKRTDESEDERKGVKRKRVDSYTLTPAAKNEKANEVVEIRTCKQYYVQNEEIRSSETRTVEFKQGGVLFKLDTLIQLIQKYGPAFLNSEGGVLLAGVTDAGIVKGLSISRSEEIRIRASIRNEIEKFRPIVTSDLWSLTFVPVKGTGNSRFSISEKLVVEISFKKGKIEDVYENGLHQVYLRRDGGVQGPLRPLDIKNFVIARYNETLKARKGLAITKSNQTSSTAVISTSKSSLKEKRLSKEDEERRARLEKKGIKFIVIDD